ncbi:MAG: transglycosylase SLT domain-containing protein [Patescibacteria group bacterium]
MTNILTVKNFVFIFIGLGLSVASMMLPKQFSSSNPIPTTPPTPTVTPEPTRRPTLPPTPTKNPTLTPHPTTTPLSIPISTSQQINEYIDRFSSQYGIDPNVLRHTALCESGFHPGATNGPYVGLFQFDATTWKTFRNLMGEDTNIDLRENAEEAVQTAAYVYSIHASRIWPHCVPKG